jgi:hypothetical protein
MAADHSGCWISTNGRLLHIDSTGRLRLVLRAPLGDVATGAGSAWLAESTEVLRVDERSGHVHVLHTGTIRPGGFQHDLAAGGHTLWVLNDAGRAHTTVQRFDARTGRRTGSVSVPGIADTLVVRPDALWVATVIAPAAKPATGYDVIRINPDTLLRTLLVHVV